MEASLHLSLPNSSIAGHRGAVRNRCSVVSGFLQAEIPFSGPPVRSLSYVVRPREQQQQKIKGTDFESMGKLMKRVACRQTRYVEMNPVVAGICDDPAYYPRSSCRSKVSGKRFEWLDLDPLYESLAPSDDEHCQRYNEFLSETVSDQEREMISGAVQRGQLTRGPSFVDEIEKRLSRRIGLRGQGRPRKVSK